MAGADHAQQAVLAALELQQRLPALYTDPKASQIAESASVWSCIPGQWRWTTSPASSNSPTTMETLHLVVWLQYLAAPGTLLTSEVTMRLVQEEVRYTAHREVYVPGQPRPVKAYTVYQSG